MKRILLKVWYYGTFFSGSQEQREKRTVEGELLRGLIKSKYITNRQDAIFRTAARTDAGVHAQDAAFCFNTAEIFYVNRLETYLPRDMGITQWAEVPLDFHPRFEASSKEYRYIYPKNPHTPLNFSLMEEAIHLLEGTHDFRLFSKTDASKPEQNTILTMEKSQVIEYPEYFVFEFRCRAFLWEQIRRTVAFLIKIGRDDLSKEDLLHKFDPVRIQDPMEKREKACNPEGLTLISLNFSKELQFHTNLKGNKRQKEYCEKNIQKLQQKAFSLLQLGWQ
ncbi:tRNA pseudouridine synthase A [Candidatus Lokiarchaeum ossiferum]|uniref:tRNA pseudouridine synthase A n=1 Tax=Candidatus Lokiarchaeum ossiferum TaxID=2951803 RepID=A0ABY6HQK0_9ARCH|nr:tRNA pseudouridine synthase A [Candidatus Lokiarchaeum sp. B-35]